MSKQPGSRPTFFDWQFRRRRLENISQTRQAYLGQTWITFSLAGFFSNLGRDLAELGQACGIAAAADAGDLRLMHDDLAEQMARQGLAPGRLTTGLGHGWRLRSSCYLLPEILLETFQLHLELVDVAVELLEAGP